MATHAHRVDGSWQTVGVHEISNVSAVALDLCIRRPCSRMAERWPPARRRWRRQDSAMSTGDADLDRVSCAGECS